MGNIFTYIEWRGDLTLSQSAFNEVDNLVLSTLCYLDLSGIVPAPGAGEITIKNAAQRYFQNTPVGSDTGRKDDESLQSLLFLFAK